MEEKIDICVVTETCLQDLDSVSIAALSPPGYHFIIKHFAIQSDRKGGGTGVLHNDIFEMKFIDVEEKSAFEFSEGNCKIANQTLKVIAFTAHHTHRHMQLLQTCSSKNLLPFLKML